MTTDRAADAEMLAADDALWIDVDSTDPVFVVQALLDHGVQNRISDLFFCAEERYTLTLSADDRPVVRTVKKKQNKCQQFTRAKKTNKQ